MHTLSRSQTIRAGGKTIPATNEISAEGLSSIDEICPVGTNVEHAIFIPTAGLKGLVLFSRVACTVKTNSSSEPDDTFTLEANKPIVWMEGDIDDSHITEDVSAVFITNAAEGQIQLFAFYDPTP